MRQKRFILYKWNPDTKKFDIPYEVNQARPGQCGQHDRPVCALCGRPTRPVMGGEAWCEHCKAYQ